MTKPNRIFIVGHMGADKAVLVNEDVNKIIKALDNDQTK